MQFRRIFTGLSCSLVKNFDSSGRPADLYAEVMDCEELLEPSEVGRMLTLSSARVSQLARQGRLTVAVRTRRGRRLFRRADVENYLRTIQRQRAERE